MRIKNYITLVIVNTLICNGLNAQLLKKTDSIPVRYLPARGLLSSLDTNKYKTQVFEGLWNIRSDDTPLKVPTTKFSAYTRYALKKRDSLNLKALYSPETPFAVPKQTGITFSSTSNILDLKSFEIIPRGHIEIIVGGEYNKNENPFINEKLRRQFGLTFDQNININIAAKIGKSISFNGNFNSKAQFDFENKFRFDYIGGTDDILKTIEIGNVNMALNSAFIQGAESLFGIKVQLQLGKLNMTSILGQKKATTKEIIIQNAAQKGSFDIKGSDYEADQHYFLGQYFRDNYNKALLLAPLINSAIQITQIEVWINNKTNTYTDARDILALVDLGESKPYNTLINSISLSNLPSTGLLGQNKTEVTNDLLHQLGESGRMANDRTVQNFFASSGGSDNYAILYAAKKLVENQDYSIDRRLGYLSLQVPLHQDEVLAVAYRYNRYGIEYQVGDLSTDIPLSTVSPTLLYTKLLKNESLNTNLPLWGLMMKNIYRLQAANFEAQEFDLQIVRTAEETGIDIPIMLEGERTQRKTWLEITNLDRLDEQYAEVPDGRFDWIPDITINNKVGRLIFPTLEPFGKDLATHFDITEQRLVDKYCFPELYQHTKNEAEYKYNNKNRYKIQGKFSTAQTNEFYLGTINLQAGAVRVMSGVLLLLEDREYTIDYDRGLLRFLDESIVMAGHPIKVTIEDNNSYNSQQKTLLGTRISYLGLKNTAIGATYMRLTEKPVTQKIIIGEEPIANTMYGLDVNYSGASKWLTRIVSKIPLIHTEEPSYIHFYGEFAKYAPSHPSTRGNVDGNEGTSYIDDFERSVTYVDIKGQEGWQIAATPRHFKESSRSNDLSYGYNRALLAFYTVDPIFYQASKFNPKVDYKYLSDHRSRRIMEKEIFPFKEQRRGTDMPLSTLDLAYYPMLRGPYNYTYTEIMPNGHFSNPRQKWAGMFKKIEKPNFEAQNIDYLEMWLLDPALTNANNTGADLYINLGNISEDILKDGRRSVENGLSLVGDDTFIAHTVWGKVTKQQPSIQSFENSDQSRAFQDVGLDGLTNEEERSFFAPFLSRIQNLISPQAYDILLDDPSSDDYIYFKGKQFASSVSILDRYRYINGTQGNSRTSTQSIKDFGETLSARTLQPDGEDLNHDNNMNENDAYYQYKLSTRPEDMIVGKNFIVDEQITTIQIINKKETVKWYKIRIPLHEYQTKVGPIQDFKTIRFVRLFITNCSDTTVLRFAKMQFVKGEWRKYNTSNNSENNIVNGSLATVSKDNSKFYISNINIEENGNRTPIPYAIPPGIQRQLDYANNNLAIQQNEQALSLHVIDLKPGYGRAAYKIAQHDFRPYGRMKIFIHAEGPYLTSGDAIAFIRIGTDDRQHYYEYEQPLTITDYGTTSADLIWPVQNRIDIPLKQFQEAKLAREKTDLNGAPWPIDIPFEYIIDNHKIIVLGMPDLSSIRFYMLGIKNPLPTAAGSAATTLGSSITGEFWFNEFRLTDYDEKGGWAAVAQLNLKVADFGNIVLSGAKSTIGFGTLSQRLGDRSRTDNLSYAVNTSFDLGRLLNPKYAISIPFYFSYSKQITTPEYNPLNPDIKLSESLAALNKRKKEALLKVSQDHSVKKSFSFTNIRKNSIDGTNTLKPWSLENIGLSYAYSELNQRNYIFAATIQRNYNAVLDYNYSNPTLSYSAPFKGIKSQYLTIFKDLTYNLVPSVITFRLDVNRIYQENTFRDNTANNMLPTYYHKNFTINSIYGISWNLSRSLRLDFNATNYAIVEEPSGRINGAKLDTLWRNFWKMGRTKDYNHMLNITYDMPINKLPFLDWITIYTRYGTQFNWQRNPFSNNSKANVDLGNSIQNNRTLQANPILNFNLLYHKFKFIRNNNGTNMRGTTAFLVQLLTAVRQLNGAYTKTEGTYLPGYLPQSNIIGIDLERNAPGFGFLFGSQGDILTKAIQKNWLTKDTLQNKQFVRTYSENISGIIHLEPIKNMKLDLIFSRIENYNKYSTTTFNEKEARFLHSISYITGNYSISQIALHSSFQNNAAHFEEFNNKKQEVSLALAQHNINSVGISSDFFADGYGKNQQDVVVNSFWQTYYRKRKINLNIKPTFPLPN